MTESAAVQQEAQRLAALREYGIDDARAEPSLDRIVQLTASIFRVPMASVSLIEDARHLFVSAVGAETCEIDRESSFCAHALGARQILEVPDATQDTRFAHNRLVVGPPFVRYYAGAPLIAPSGHILGTLCIIDVYPRPRLNSEERANLAALAALVMDRLELRRLDLAWQSSPGRFENMARVSPDAIVCVDERARITFWNPAAERLFGYSRSEMINASVAKLTSNDVAEALLTLAADQSSLSVGRTLEQDIRSASGVTIPVEISTSMWREDGHASFCAVLRDATERRQNEQRLYRLAHVDALTDLPNRVLFRERVDAALASGMHGGLLMVDLDGFKNVNDSFGHAAGDAMLVATAQRLLAAVPDSATVARMGGDEFALVLPGVDETRIEQIANDIIDTVSQPVPLDGSQMSVGASVGMARFPDDGATFRELLSSSDLALYEAKAHGKQCSRFYSSLLRDASLARQAYQTEIPRAHREHEWVLHFEPIVRLEDGARVGADVQLRWQHPEHGLLNLSEFAGALQSSPVAAKVGHWMLECACAQLAQWRRMQPDLRISVALLDAQFRGSDLAARVGACLAHYALPGSALELELTEAVLLRRDVQSVATLEQLRELGVAIALANYGTGHVSLERIKHAPLTRLKIDPVFVRSMFDSRADAAIIRVILYLGRSLGLAVTAKGVTDPEQAVRLLKKGCEEAQGGPLGEAVPAEAFAAMIGA